MNVMKKIVFFFTCSLFIEKSFSQEVKIYPSNWWVGMKWNKPQLLVRGKNISESVAAAQVTFPGVKVLKTTKVSSPNYLLVDLDIQENAKPGRFDINLLGVANSIKKVEFELKAKNKGDGKTRIQGVTSKDAIYLLMPDRFANGDPSNDAFNDMRDNSSDRSNKYARHGGDIKGIMDHLDYFNELGVTTIWCTPLIENDMPKMKEGSIDLSGFH